MAIFYTDTGSFNNLEVTGSAIVSGSLIVSGGIAGDTSVFFNDGLIVTGSTILSGSLTISGNTNFAGGIITTIVSASIITGSHVQLVNVTDTTSANKVLVLNTSTNKIFTTASILPSGLISSSQQFTSLTAPFTGSFTGSFNGSLDRFSPVALRISVGTTAPVSPSINDLWVDTN